MSTIDMEPVAVIIESTVETSNHDGYCSEEECVYRRYKKTTRVPINCKNQNIITEANAAQSSMDVNKNFWKRFVKVNTDNIYDFSKSGYCEPCNRSTKHGLDTHEYRCTVNSVKLVDAIDTTEDKDWDSEYSDDEVDWR